MIVLYTGTFYHRFVGNISSSKAETMVKDLFDGVYLVREDNKCRGEYEICIKYDFCMLIVGKVRI